MADNIIEAVSSANNSLVWTREEIETIKRTVAKDATDDELRMFLHLAKSYGLDPFARDIWFIKDSKNANARPIIMTSRDGYLKIANRDANFDGMDADVVYEGDIFKKTPSGVEHVYGTNNRGAAIGAYAIVYRKDKTRPVYVYAPITDYKRNNSTWQQYQHAMILKVAEAQALKRAFSISGMVTTEELEVSNDRLNKPKDPFYERERQHLWQTILNLCGSADLAKFEIQTVVGVKPSEEWDAGDKLMLWDLIERLKNGQFANFQRLELSPAQDAQIVEPQAVQTGGAAQNEL